MIPLKSLFGRCVRPALGAGLLCAVLAVLARPASAQQGEGALRAPLNIIPFVMQDVIGAKSPASQTGEKLAPRIAARQSKRAVRAVAAAPGSEGGLVQVGSLGTLQDAPVGLERGYGPDLWRGARLAFIADQMARLPTPLALDGLRDIELTLHRGATAAPIGTVDGTSWYAARLNRFLALGDTASVLALEQLTGAARADAYAAQALAKAHLGRGEPAAACAVPWPNKRLVGYGDTLPFFMRLLVYCQLRNGEFEKAGLALELNEKTLGADRLFRDIAYLMAAQVTPVFGTTEQVEAAKQAGNEPPLVLPNELKPLHIALLQLAGQPLPTSLTNIPAYMTASIAADYGQVPLVQLQAALAHAVAVPRRQMPHDVFSQTAQLVDLSAWPDPYATLTLLPDTDEAEQGEEPGVEAPLPPAVFLAYSLRRVDMAEPAAQPRTLADVLRQANSVGLWAQATRLLHDRLIAVSPEAAALEPANAPPDDGVGPDDSLEPETNEPGIAAPGPQTGEPAQISDADKSVLVTAMAYLGLRPQVESLTASAVLDETAQRVLNYGQTPVPLDDLLAALAESDLASVDVAPRTISEAVSEIGTETGLPTLEGGATGEAAASVFEMPMADNRPHPISNFAAYEARLATAGPALQKFMRRELAIYQGLNFELPGELAIDFAAPLSDAEDAVQKRLDKLVTSQWTGDLLLALIAQFGGTASAQMTDRQLVQLLSALHGVGLTDAAHELGGALLALATAELSITTPDALIVSP